MRHSIKSYTVLYRICILSTVQLTKYIYGTKLWAGHQGS